jgi:glucose/arabinose dehydrogenase
MRSFLPVLLLLAASSAPAGIEPKDLSRLVPADGWSLEVLIPKVPGARSLTSSPSGTLFIGTRADRVYAWRDGKLVTLAKNLRQPNGVAVRDGNLYVAEIHRILRFKDVDARLDRMLADPKVALDTGLSYDVVYSKLPTDGHHGWKFIAFGPDGALYVPVGAPCNICEKEDPRYASILRFAKLDGSDPEVYARGIRNTVGFAWHPTTKELWFTDNGGDGLGEDMPADELNVAPKAGLHFGFPYCHQGDFADPDHGKKRPCSEFTRPVHKFGAHVAALGMRFLDADTALVALHGSWNRKVPDGYRVVRVRLKGGKPVAEEPFLGGFLRKDESTIGRPVDVEVRKDGVVLVSDDDAGVVYRMVRKK